MTWEMLEQALDATGMDYARQGSYAEAGDLPASFFTFWNLETPETAFYDDVPGAAVWRWQVYFYTRDPSLLYSAMDALLAEARARGFVLEGRARDIDADEPGYAGRTARLAYRQETVSEENSEESDDS